MACKSKKKEDELICTTVKFSFPMTSDEAFDILKNKNGKIAKRFRVYLNEVLTATAKKCLEALKEVKEREAMEAIMTVDSEEETDCKE